MGIGRRAGGRSENISDSFSGVNILRVRVERFVLLFTDRNSGRETRNRNFLCSGGGYAAACAAG